jgi:hypothetical protein
MSLATRKLAVEEANAVWPFESYTGPAALARTFALGSRETIAISNALLDPQRTRRMRKDYSKTRIKFGNTR